MRNSPEGKYAIPAGSGLGGTHADVLMVRISAPSGGVPASVVALAVPEYPERFPAASTALTR